MRPNYLLTLLAVLCFSITNAQISLDHISDIRSGKDVKEIDIQHALYSGQLLLEENGLLSPEIQEQHPNLHSYDLTNPSNSIQGKLTISPELAVIHLKKGADFITLVLDEPAGGNTQWKVSSSAVKPQCGTEETPKFFGQNHVKQAPALKSAVAADDLSYGETRRTFRLALVGTGEFTENNGGTSASALAVATSSVNGINLIFENEANLTLTLVGTQFYTNSSTDPFTPDGAGGDSRTNQAAEVVASNFSNSSYDIGHVFHYYTFGSSWGAGGIAGLGVVCDNGTFFSGFDSDGLTGPNKAAAWSGSFNNTDNSWIQLATHEFGHQFDALHTFNGGGNGNCNSGISSSTAYEIGSGTTLMAYSGLCPAAQNVPPNGEADNYFHSTTLDRIDAFLNSQSCYQNTATGNTPPDPHTNYSGTPLTIPIGTPFELTGLATDAEGDDLTFTWEQIDEDGAGTPTQAFIGAQAAGSAIAPLFKAVPPSDSPTRIFPELDEILNGNNENLDFESLPQVSRTMNFSFIARDNQGGVGSDAYVLNSSDSAGPFRVDSQNSSTTWTANGSNTATITWNVADTDNASVNCQLVEILLSTDNGQTFDYAISESTENDGSFTFTIPNLPTNTGRVKIKAVGNVFFDINDSAIEITSDCEANGASFTPDASVSADEGDPALNLGLMPEYGNVIPSFSGTITNDDQASTVAGDNGSGTCVNFNGNFTLADSFPFSVSESGSYTFTKSSGAFGLVISIYEGDFIAGSPCTNWLAGTFDNGQGTILNSASVNLSAGVSYTLVMGTFNVGFPSAPSPYSISYSGPGDAVDGAVAPAGFEYYYVVTDQLSTDIVSISTSSDLTAFSEGEYVIYGLSGLPGEDFSSYINQPFSSLEQDLISLTTCGNLSSNSMMVEIIGDGTDPCPGDFNNDGVVNVGDLGGFLGAFGCSLPDECEGDFNGDGNTNVGDLGGFLGAFGTECD